MDKTLKTDNLFNGYIAPRVVKGVEVEAGTYLRGTAIGEVAGTFKQIGESTYEATTLYGIVANDVTLASKGKVEVYLSGEFNKEALNVKSGANVNDLVIPGRKIGIFIS
ncbi:hypothetical protein SAMN02745174_02052 [Cetobacterium ceti]|uniref:Bacteriophage lambda head decoration protein D n=1 Tax=Cetobacterium ceti TaxID=180163 RepID=A0A1T4PUT0_9FUSO|nr:hypothetical protein [Cetobacterium ceti]SJZ95305.1 hypothetical protein SAMN02745174_02052 [Cetobacterium ceti]